MTNLLAIFLAACGRPAGPLNLAEVGNGGHGVVIGGKVYLVDLVQAGLEHSVGAFYIEHKKKNNFEGLLRHGVLTNGRDSGDSSLFPYRSVGERLYGIYQGQPVLAMALLETIRMYQWNFIDRELNKIPLRGTVASFDEGTVMLVANRSGRSIYVSAPAFKRMDDLNRAALVIHEALYALIRPTRIEGKLTQNTARVREVTSHLFSRLDFTTPSDAKRTEELLGDDFPGLADHGLEARDATLVSHLLPGRVGARVIVADPTLVLEGPTIPEVGELQFRIESPRDLIVRWHTVETWFRAANFDAQQALALRIAPGDEARKGAVLLRFADYENNGEIKTYVATEMATAPYTTSATPMEHPHETKDIEVRAWLALLRAKMRLQPGDVAVGTTEAYRRASQLARETEVLLPRYPFMGARFKPD